LTFSGIPVADAILEDIVNSLNEEADVRSLWEDCGVEGLMREVGFVRELRSTDLDDTFQFQSGKVEEGLANKKIAY
jgi:hypothetical protein